MLGDEFAPARTRLSASLRTGRVSDEDPSRQLVAVADHGLRDVESIAERLAGWRT